MSTGTTKVNLNLRSGPDPSNPVLKVLPQGTQVTVLDMPSAGWVHAQAPDGTVGYLAAQYVDLPPVTITVNPPQADSQPVIPPIVTQPVTQPTATKLLVATGNGVNVRSSAGVVNNPDNKIDAVAAAEAMTPLESDSAVAAKIGTTEAQNQWINVKTARVASGYVAAWLVAYQGTVQTPISVAPTGDLNSFIASIPADAVKIPQGYYDFWAKRAILGLPDPFDVSPTDPGYPALTRMQVNGFGPNTFSLHNWTQYYSHVDGMHNGLDHIVKFGTPLLAVADGVIIGTQAQWQFLGNANDKSIILWCFMPTSANDAQGRRTMSNVLVAYGHLSDNTRVKRHDVVKAGDVIGISGRPYGETGNDHLHMEVHLLSGDSKIYRPSGRQLLTDYRHAQPFDNSAPFNPMLFFSERLVRYQTYLGERVGFGGSEPTYPNAQLLAANGLSAWSALDFFTLANFRYGAAPIWTVKTLPWPAGIYDLPTEITRINDFTPFVPYPIDFLNP